MAADFTSELKACRVRAKSKGRSDNEGSSLGLEDFGKRFGDDAASGAHGLALLKAVCDAWAGR